MRRLFPLLALAAVSACAGSDPQEGASIDYRLPRTDATITLGLDVKGCSPDLDVEPTLKIDGVAGAQSGWLQVAGRDLVSGVTKRNLTIGVDERGVITSVNATATDQTTVILGNMVKIAGSIAKFAATTASGHRAKLVCNAETQKNVELALKLPAKIVAARGKLLSGADPVAARREVDALVSQLAAVKIALHEEVTADLKLAPSLRRSAGVVAGEELKFNFKPFARLFDTAYFGPSPLPPTKPGVIDDTKQLFKVTAYYEETLASTNGLGQVRSDELAACTQWMMVPAARPVKVMLEPSGDLVSGVLETGEKTVAATVSAAQLGDAAKLCLSATFGENRTVGLKFDKFGRRTEFTWSADATAANVTSAFAGAASDASSLITTLQGRSLAADKLELDRLTTSQDLRKARACQALLDAGATSCD